METIKSEPPDECVETQSLNNEANPPPSKRPRLSNPSDFQSQIDCLKKKLEEEQELRNQLQNALATKDETIKRVQNLHHQTSDIVTNFNDRLRKANAQIQNDADKIAALENLNNSRKKENDALVEKLKANQQVNDLETQNRELIDKLVAINGNQNNLVNEVATANTQITKLKQENKNFKESVQSLNQRLMSKNCELSKFNAELQKQKDEHTAQLEKLDTSQKKYHSNSIVQINKLKAQLEKYSRKVVELKKQVEDKDTELATKAIQLSELDSKCKKHESELAASVTQASTQNGDNLAKIKKLENLANAQKNKLRENVAQIKKLQTQQQTDSEKIARLKKRCEISEREKLEAINTISELKTQHSSDMFSLENANTWSDYWKNLYDKSGETIGILKGENYNLKLKLDDLYNHLHNNSMQMASALERNIDLVQVESRADNLQRRIFSDAQLSSFITDGSKLAKQIIKEGTKNTSNLDDQKESRDKMFRQIQTRVQNLTLKALSANLSGDYDNLLKYMYKAIGIQQQLPASNDKELLGFIWGVVGQIFANLECYHKAFRCYEKSTNLDKSNASIHYNCALLHFKLNELYLAKLHVKKALTLNPDCSKFQMLLTDIRAKDNAREQFS